MTNALHATALGVYTLLVLKGVYSGNKDYTVLICLTFLSVFILKVLGIIVHLPLVDKVRTRHNCFWILISVFVVFLNGLTLAAIGAGPLWIAVGVVWTAILSSMYVKSLYSDSWGSFLYIALAMIGIYVLCALLSEKELRIAWCLAVVSNVLWILLEKVTFLNKHKLHNDIYHLALICSSYYLYTTIEMGLWGKGR